MEFGVVMTGAAQTVSEFNSANHWQIGYVVLMILTVILLIEIRKANYFSGGI